MMLCKMALVTMVAGSCLAQTAAQPKFFRLDFTVREMDGTKVITSRKYAMTVEADAKNAMGSIRSGSKVPVHTGNPGSALASTQSTYVEVGVNIDCTDIRVLDSSNLTLRVTSDVSSTATPADGNPIPVIRQNKWSSTVVIPLKKTTMLFSADDPASTHEMQLEVVATPIG